MRIGGTGAGCVRREFLSPTVRRPATGAFNDPTSRKPPKLGPLGTDRTRQGSCPYKVGDGLGHREVWGSRRAVALPREVWPTLPRGSKVATDPPGDYPMCGTMSTGRSRTSVSPPGLSSAPHLAVRGRCVDTHTHRSDGQAAASREPPERGRVLMGEPAAVRPPGVPELLDSDTAETRHRLRPCRQSPHKSPRRRAAAAGACKRLYPRRVRSSGVLQ